MALTFDQIPSEIEIGREEPEQPTVAEELAARQQMLQQRQTICSTIKPLYKTPKRPPLRYTYKFFCICPRYKPSYCCKHAGNVILDRDVLTKNEHICYLSTPKENYAAPRQLPRMVQKKSIFPNCTSRIEKLALPKMTRVKDNLDLHQEVLMERQYNQLKQYLDKKPEVEHTNINTALEFIEEERRLKRVAKNIRQRQCRRLKRHILRKQRRQITKIICVLFEEMKDFLLNDQFLIDERSTLCAVILEQIRDFTDQEFYTTNNLREYQHILANNLTVWINKFISNLNIHLPPPPQPTRKECPIQDTFVPVDDYIICSESQIGEEECMPTSEREDYYYPEGENEYSFMTGPYTEDPGVPE